MYCKHCGSTLTDNAKFCPECGAPVSTSHVTDVTENEGTFQSNTDSNYGNYGGPKKSKVTAGILGILLGGLGVHKFYLGYTTSGVIMLLITLLTCGFGGSVMGIIGLIEGILYLTKTDEEFYETYELNEKQWF